MTPTKTTPRITTTSPEGTLTPIQVQHNSAQQLRPAAGSPLRREVQQQHRSHSLPRVVATRGKSRKAHSPSSLPPSSANSSRSPASSPSSGTGSSCHQRRSPAAPYLSPLGRARRSPYFLPVLVAFFALTCFLIISAVRIASKWSEVQLGTTAKKSSAPVYGHQQPVSVDDASIPSQSVPVQPSSAAAASAVAARARALYKTWELEAEQVRQRSSPISSPRRAASNEDQSSTTASNAQDEKMMQPHHVREELDAVALGQSELEAAKARYDELKNELGGFSTDDLTQLLHDLNRG